MSIGFKFKRFIAATGLAAACASQLLPPVFNGGHPHDPEYAY